MKLRMGCRKSPKTDLRRVSKRAPRLIPPPERSKGSTDSAFRSVAIRMRVLRHRSKSHAHSNEIRHRAVHPPGVVPVRVIVVVLLRQVGLSREPSPASNERHDKAAAQEGAAEREHADANVDRAAEVGEEHARLGGGARRQRVGGGSLPHIRHPGLGAHRRRRRGRRRLRRRRFGGRRWRRR